jgi:hypothetical protein
MHAGTYAVRQAAPRDSDLTVVHAWEVGLGEGALALNAPMEVWEGLEEERVAMTAEAVAGWAEKYPDVHIHTRDVRGRPVDA